MSDAPSVQPIVQPAAGANTLAISTSNSATPNFLATNSVQQRNALDIQLTPDHLATIVVTKARERLQQLIKETQATIRETQAEATKFSKSIEDSFINWHKQFESDPRFAALNTALTSFTPGSPFITQGSVMNDWRGGITTSTLAYSWGNRDGSVTSSVKLPVSAPIPADVLASYASLQTLNTQLRELEEQVTNYRRKVGNVAGMRELAMSRIATNHLKMSGNTELATSLDTSSVSDEFLDSLQ